MNKEEVLISILEAGEIEIDEKGRIWRLMRRHGRGVAKGGGYESGSRVSPCPRVRAEYPTREGYLLIATTIDGVKTVTGAHRVVWTYFNGQPIPPGITINHKNGIKNDNRPSNLELATYSEQRRHALDVLKVKRHQPKGSLHPKTKLTEDDVVNMRALRAEGMMVKDIAAQYLMKRKAVSAICTRKTWKHV